MARKSAYRWRDWRTNESGQTIRSSKGKGKRKRSKKRSKKKRRSTPDWWWIASRFDGTCDGCSEVFGAGDRICWRGEPKRVLCEICAEREGVSSEAKLSKSVKPERASVPPRSSVSNPCGAEYPDGLCELERGHRGLCETRFERGFARWRSPYPASVASRLR